MIVCLCEKTVSLCSLLSSVSLLYVLCLWSRLFLSLLSFLSERFLLCLLSVFSSPDLGMQRTCTPIHRAQHTPELVVSSASLPPSMFSIPYNLIRHGINGVNNLIFIGEYSKHKRLGLHFKLVVRESWTER